MNKQDDSSAIFLFTVGLAGWAVPGAGYWLINEKKRAAVIFIAILTTFAIGLYIGSYGVVNPVHAKPWYLAQILTSPAVAILGHFSTVNDMLIFGRENDYGQIYTGIAGLLNLLAIINSVYLAYAKKVQEEVK